jgi:hypothetical protein
MITVDTGGQLIGPTLIDGMEDDLQKFILHLAQSANS